MKTEQNLHRLTINVGKTVSDRLNYVSQIKHAMCMAMMLHIENDMADKENEDLSIYSSLYLEADLLESQLKRL